MEDDEWEVCTLWHNKKHEIKLSIRKDSKLRHTYCIQCGHSVAFERKPIQPEGEDMNSIMDTVVNSEDPRNWKEDFPHENGNYLCKCMDCGEPFVGHKRRVRCKICSNNLLKAPNINGALM